VRVLLDENIPLRLYRRLRDQDREAEHLALEQRGTPDAEIVQRLTDDNDLVLVTQDRDFEHVRLLRGGKVVISRLSQSMPIDERVDLWLAALESFLDAPPTGALFEIAESGEVVSLPE